jgi:hypothetical protein
MSYKVGTEPKFVVISRELKPACPDASTCTVLLTSTTLFQAIKQFSPPPPGNLEQIPHGRKLHEIPYLVPPSIYYGAHFSTHA